MDMLSTIMLALAGLAIIGGVFFGMIRGRNRSVLRLILIIGCAVGAIYFLPTITTFIMEVNVGSGTVGEMIAGSIKGLDSLPSSMRFLVDAMVNIVIGIIAYLLAFGVLRFVSWLIVFPILKKIIKQDLIRSTLGGAIFGLLQGLVIIIAVLVPINGMLVEINSITKMDLGEEISIELPEEIDIDKYSQSEISKTFNTVGGWYYSRLNTYKTEKYEITLSGTIYVINSMVQFASSLEEVGNSLDVLMPEKGTQISARDKVDTLKASSQKIQNAADVFEGLDQKTSKLFNDILSDIEELPIEGMEEYQDLLDGLTIEKLNLSSIADGLDGLANYIEKKEIYNGNINQNDLDKIVEGIADSQFLVELLIGDGTKNIDALYEITDLSEKTMLMNSVVDTDLTPVQKQAMLKLFGIN